MQLVECTFQRWAPVVVVLVACRQKFDPAQDAQMGALSRTDPHLCKTSERIPDGFQSPSARHRNLSWDRRHLQLSRRASVESNAALPSMMRIHFIPKSLVAT